MVLGGFWVDRADESEAKKTRSHSFLKPSVPSPRSPLPLNTPFQERAPLSLNHARGGHRAKTALPFTFFSPRAHRTMATVAPPQATSAAGLLSLLAEPDPALQAAALARLDAVVGSFWFQVADSLSAIEARAEDDAFEHRELAALVASKVRVWKGESVCRVRWAKKGSDAGAGGRCADTRCAHRKQKGATGTVRCCSRLPPFPALGLALANRRSPGQKRGTGKPARRLPRHNVSPFFVRPSFTGLLPPRRTRRRPHLRPAGRPQV